MSISNTVSKVEEFEYDNASETTIDNELEKSSSTTEGKTAVREEFGDARNVAVPNGFGHGLPE